MQEENWLSRIEFTGFFLFVSLFPFVKTILKNLREIQEQSSPDFMIETASG